MVMVFIYTHLGITPLAGVIAVNVLLYIGVTSRIISASALMSAVPEPASRGAFMSVNAAIQQLSGGLASTAAGLIVSQDAGGRLRHYDVLGYVVLVAMVLAMTMLYRINRRWRPRPRPRPWPLRRPDRRHFYPGRRRATASVG